MSDIDLILSSLELVAERNIDITGPAYEYYFEASPKSRELMSHMDQLMCGRMLSEVINLMMMPDDSDRHDVVRFEVQTHAANGVDNQMYEKMFNAIHLTVRDSLNGEWTPAFEAAWKNQITRLNNAIESQIESDARCQRG